MELTKIRIGVGSLAFICGPILVLWKDHLITGKPCTSLYFYCSSDLKKFLPIVQILIPCVVGFSLSTWKFLCHYANVIFFLVYTSMCGIHTWIVLRLPDWFVYSATIQIQVSSFEFIHGPVLVLWKYYMTSENAICLYVCFFMVSGNSFLLCKFAILLFEDFQKFREVTFSQASWIFRRTRRISIWKGFAVTELSPRLSENPGPHWQLWVDSEDNVDEVKI